jgi:hypothetical protein
MQLIQKGKLREKQEQKKNVYFFTTTFKVYTHCSAKSLVFYNGQKSS